MNLSTLLGGRLHWQPCKDILMWVVAPKSSCDHISCRRNISPQLVVPLPSYSVKNFQQPFSFYTESWWPSEHFQSSLFSVSPLLAHSEISAHLVSIFLSECYNLLWIVRSVVEEKLETKCTIKSSGSFNFSALSFDARLDISKMYSLMFPLPL